MTYFSLTLTMDRVCVFRVPCKKGKNILAIKWRTWDSVSASSWQSDMKGKII